MSDSCTAQEVLPYEIPFPNLDKASCSPWTASSPAKLWGNLLLLLVQLELLSFVRCFSSTLLMSLVDFRLCGVHRNKFAHAWNVWWAWRGIFSCRMIRFSQGLHLLLSSAWAAVKASLPMHCLSSTCEGTGADVASSPELCWAKTCPSDAWWTGVTSVLLISTMALGS